jgi:hypothetical protein
MVQQNPSLVESATASVAGLKDLQLAVKEQLVQPYPSWPVIKHQHYDQADHILGWAKGLLLLPISGYELTETQTVVSRTLAQEQYDSHSIMALTVIISTAFWFVKGLARLEEVEQFSDFVGSRSQPMDSEIHGQAEILYVRNNHSWIKARITAAIGSDVIHFYSDVEFQVGQRFDIIANPSKSYHGATLVKIIRIN